MRMRPFGYIPDLWAKVVLLLEQNERYMARWEVTRGPDLVKDRGGGTFKMAVQIVNVQKPNSPNMANEEVSRC